MRLAGALLMAVVAGALAHAAATQWPLPQVLAWLDASPGGTAPSSGLAGWRLVLAIAGAAALLAAVAWLSSLLVAPLGRLVRALEGAALSYRDGDFSVAIPAGRDDELADLIRAHHDLGNAFRQQRQHLAQRELLLDTVVQNTPVALVLVDEARARVAYANIAARHLLGSGRSLEGEGFAELLHALPPALKSAIEAGEDTLLGLMIDEGEETFHLSQREFRLQGRPHRLHSFRRMTRELSRQEVATWKRVIRVISHELNNSLAPISSLAHSGAELLRRDDHGRLPGVLATIGERARHLHSFLEGYARFAKLPTPIPGAIVWQPFLDGLAHHFPLTRVGDAPQAPGWFDAAQIEQALINLLKNAFEAGGPDGEVTLAIVVGSQETRLEVADRGPGMSEAVLAQALLPFYSTKRSGSGLGLALAREIAEAHGGRVTLANREGGGLRVAIVLPRRRVEAEPGLSVSAE